LDFFIKKYPKVLFYPQDNYYLIDEGSSKLSFGEFKDFCDKLNLPYKIEIPSNEFIKEGSVINGFNVPEPIFNLTALRKELEKETKERRIKIQTNSEIVGLNPGATSHQLLIKNLDSISEEPTDIILNSTYAYANNVMKALGLTGDFVKYKLQKTEVLVVKSKTPLPPLTIMDGKFVSLMPLASDEKRESYLIYDVINSVIEQKEGYLLENSLIKSNKEEILNHCRKYFPFVDNLEYVKSLYGARPIPLEAIGDSRTTRIKKHDSLLGVYSILEGKFISAPLIAEEFTLRLKQDGILG